MLINITNHLSKDWDEFQRSEALKQFENVIDYPFPRVDPNDGLTEIERLADEIIAEISMKYKLPFSVHVMGEFTLCYQLIKRFLAMNIPCYASTTMRGDSEFTFVLFRPYFNL